MSRWSAGRRGQVGRRCGAPRAVGLPGGAAALGDGGAPHLRRVDNVLDEGRPVVRPLLLDDLDEDDVELGHEDLARGGRGAGGGGQGRGGSVCRRDQLAVARRGERWRGERRELGEAERGPAGGGSRAHPLGAERRLVGRLLNDQVDDEVLDAILPSSGKGVRCGLVGCGRSAARRQACCVHQRSQHRQRRPPRRRASSLSPLAALRPAPRSSDGRPPPPPPHSHTLPPRACCGGGSVFQRYLIAPSRICRA